MKILVIGGTYFLGKCFVNMAAKTHELTLLNRGTAMSESMKEQVNWIRMDRHDLGKAVPKALAELEADAVVDFCAYEKGDIDAVVSSLGKGIKKYVFISTCDVYERGTGEERTEESPLEERSFPGQAGAYIRGKVALEKELDRVCAEKGIQGVSIRPAFIYGPDNYAPRESVYFRWMQAAGQIIEPVQEDETPATGFFQLAHVADVAKAILFACENDIGRALNVCGDKMDYAGFSQCLKALLPSLTVLRLPISQVLEKQVPLPFPFYKEESEWYSNRAMKKWGLDCMEPETGMRETYRWYLENVAKPAETPEMTSATEAKENDCAEEILKRIDSLLEAGQAKEAEHYMLTCLDRARRREDRSLELTILNELIGYYRVTSRADKLREVMEQAIILGKEMGLDNSVPFATTLLNVANGYRSIQEADTSLEYYRITEKIYREQLAPDDLNMAGLYNNKSLLLEEMQRYGEAKECLDKALEIVTKQNAEFEIAVTHANLANTLAAMKRWKEAASHANESISRFRNMNCLDAHYAAALSALAMCRSENGEYHEAVSLLREGMEIVEQSYGHNSQYLRLKENYEKCLAAAEKTENGQTMRNGLEICRLYYEEVGKPMIAENFPAFRSKIAVGLVGEGSDCFGFDDALSRDHDWGPGFCMWVTQETYDAIGPQLQALYEQLPDEFMGFHRAREVSGAGRRGVFVIEAFYDKLLGYPFTEEHYPDIKEYALAAAVNGRVFCDEEGIFTRIREKIKCGYSQHFTLLLIAQDLAAVSQNLQYNYFRMLKRGDFLTADLMLTNGIRAALQLKHHMEHCYAPHDKWLRKSVSRMDEGESLLLLLEKMRQCLGQCEKTRTDAAMADMERLSKELGEYFAKRLYAMDMISDTDDYLDHHVDELLLKSVLAQLTKEEVVAKILALEAEAYEALCFATGEGESLKTEEYKEARKQMYDNWSMPMLWQYYYDFSREYNLGHNLLAEKRQRMLEFSAPKEYEKVKDTLPYVDEQKKQVLEAIVPLCTKDPEQANELRSELLTYSDKMIQLYGRLVIERRQGDICDEAAGNGI